MLNIPFYISVTCYFAYLRFRVQLFKLVAFLLRTWVLGSQNTQYI